MLLGIKQAKADNLSLALDKLVETLVVRRSKVRCVMCTPATRCLGSSEYLGISSTYISPDKGFTLIIRS